MSRRVEEHYIDRWNRLGVNFNQLVETENGYWFNFCKKGNHSFKRAEFWGNPVTMLNECALCGKKSTPKKVHCRNGVYGWNREHRKDFSFINKNTLCMGCWNKVRVVVKRKEQADEIRRLTGKLYREALKWQKSQPLAS